MSSKQIKIKGAPALLILVAIVAFAGFRLMGARQTLDTDGREILRQWISAEYIRYHLDRTDLTDEERASILLAADTVNFSVSARGRPSRTIVRVEIDPGRAHPPGSPTVRYYRMSYSTITGWRHNGHTTAVGYYLAF